MASAEGARRCTRGAPIFAQGPFRPCLYAPFVQGPPTAPRAVLLDALGTLVALEPPWPALVRELRLRYGIEVSLAQATSALRAEMAYYRAHCHEARDPQTLADLRRRCTQVVADSIGGPLTRVDMSGLTDALLAALRFLPYPDARPALEALRRDHRRAVVVSNWDVSLHDVLERTGLADLLDGVVTSAELGVAKPSPAIFSAALELAGVRATDAVHVGDSYEEDVVGARAAGIEPLLLVRRDSALLAAGGQAPDRTAPDGVRTIASLAELAAVAA
jgi:putative hydrolase of the HAD superfamily